MELELKDGTGTGSRQKVKDNRAFTDSVTRTQFQQSILNQRGYNVSTGQIVLTNAVSSAVLYIKNNEDLTMIIKEILVIQSGSTGGTGNSTISVLRNPNAGTIITNAVVAPVILNRDFGSTRTLNANVYKGATSNTQTTTDGTITTTRDANFSGVVAFDAEVIILRKGNTIGLNYQPATGNTSQTVTVAITLVVADLE